MMTYEESRTLREIRSRFGSRASRLKTPDTLYPRSQVAIGLTWAELPQFAFQFWELKSLLAPVALKVKILLGLKAPV